MKWIDIPPVWLLMALGMARLMADLQPYALRYGSPTTDFLGGLLVGGGVVLILLAAVALWRHKTTIVPHQQASALVTRGVYARSRNPIYLGDALILAGMTLRWDVPVALVLVPLFMATVSQRFILPEEDRLRRQFRLDFAKYCEKTRRWV